MPYSPSYNVSYLPAAAGSDSLVWLVAEKRLASMKPWQAALWVSQGKAKRVQVHVRHRGQNPPGGDIAQSTNPNVVDVYLPGSSGYDQAVQGKSDFAPQVTYRLGTV